MFADVDHAGTRYVKVDVDVATDLAAAWDPAGLPPSLGDRERRLRFLPSDHSAEAIAADLLSAAGSWSVDDDGVWQLDRSSDDGAAAAARERAA